MAAVFRASFRTAMPWLPELHSPQEDIPFFSNHVFDSNMVYIAIDRTSSRVIGFIAFSPTMINHLYVLPQASRRGLGSRLIPLAKDQGGILQLWAFQRNVAAMQFFQSKASG